MTRLYLASIDVLRQQSAASKALFLSPAEFSRWRSFQRPERREQYRLGRWFLRRVLEQARGGRPGDWQISADGAPIANHARGWQAPWLSLSHSGPWFAAAVCDLGPVGVDLEQCGQRRPWRRMAQHLGWRLGAGNPEQVFLRQWTAFEAAYKCPLESRLHAFSARRFLGSLAVPRWSPTPIACFGMRPPAAWRWI